MKVTTYSSWSQNTISRWKSEHMIVFDSRIVFLKTSLLVQNCAVEKLKKMSVGHPRKPEKKKCASKSTLEIIQEHPFISK